MKMKTSKLQTLNVEELSSVDGGIVPIILGGIYFSAKATFAVGVLIGAAVAIAVAD